MNRLIGPDITTMYAFENLKTSLFCFFLFLWFSDRSRHRSKKDNATNAMTKKGQFNEWRTSHQSQTSYNGSSLQRNLRSDFEQKARLNPNSKGVWASNSNKVLTIKNNLRILEEKKDYESETRNATTMVSKTHDAKRERNEWRNNSFPPKAKNARWIKEVMETLTVETSLMTPNFWSGNT